MAQTQVAGMREDVATRDVARGSSTYVRIMAPTRSHLPATYGTGLANRHCPCDGCTYARVSRIAARGEAQP